MNEPPLLSRANDTDWVCPYLGLQPYTEEERDYFFGREEDQETIAANVIATPLTVLYGASGVGKSSVLLAGVVPLLRQARWGVIVFRSWQHPDPLAALKREVRSALSLSDTEPSKELDPIVRFDQFVVQACRPSEKRLIFIFDQFEEYFLYHPSGDDEMEFDAALARMINRSDSPAHFLLSLREDSLSKLDRFQGRIPNLLNTLLRLEHLDPSGARRAVRKPLEVHNARNSLDQKVEIEEPLVETVLDQVQTGRVTLGRVTEETTVRLFSKFKPAPCVETPFLQMVLVRLWQAEMHQGSRVLRKSTLDGLGGAQRIVRTHLDEAMAGLAPAERDLAASVFHYMVTPSGMKIAYTVEDLAAYGGRPAHELRPVLEKLCGSELRILRKVSPTPDQAQLVRYEIYHDVLAAAVLDWRSRYLGHEQQRRHQALEEQLLRERAEARRHLAWVPWIVGFLADLFLCLPVGAFISTAMLRSKNAALSRARIIAIWAAWGVVWLSAIPLYWVVRQVASGFIGLEPANDQSEVKDLLHGLIVMLAHVYQAVAGPLVGWFIYRHRSAQGSSEPASLPMEPPKRAPSRSFLWLPWLMGVVPDIFLCLPAGAWVTGAMVDYLKPGQFRKPLRWAKLTWIVTWFAAWFVFFGIVAAIPAGVEDDSELTGSDVAIVAALIVRGLLAPLAGWVVFFVLIRSFERRRKQGEVIHDL